MGSRADVYKRQPYSLGASSSEYISRLEEGRFDLALVGINLNRCGDLRPLLSAAGSLNYSNWSGGELSTLAAEVVNARDESAYRDAMSRLQLRFVEDLPFLTLYFRQHSLVYSARIQGVGTLRKPDVLNGLELWYMNME